MFRFAIGIFLVLMLGGCAIHPITREDAKGIPESRLVQKDLIKEREGRVQILFIRETASHSIFGTSANITINKEPLARLWDGEMFSIWVEPSLYIIGLRGSERLVGNEAAFARSDFPMRKVEIEARIGRRYEVRIDMANSSGVPLQVNSTPVAK